MARFQTLRYTTTVKGQIPVRKAVAALHDHTFFLQANPSLILVEANNTQRGPPPPPPPPAVPQTPLTPRDEDDCDAAGGGGQQSHSQQQPQQLLLPTTAAASFATATTRYYDVVDRVPAAGFFADLLPGLKTVTKHYQITDTRDGLVVVLHAPLGVTQERRWVVEGEGAGEGEADEGGPVGVVAVRRIREYVTISCGTMLYGSVKGEQDALWKKWHAALVHMLGGEVGAQVLG